jgi:hypothetical protein
MVAADMLIRTGKKSLVAVKTILFPPVSVGHPMLSPRAIQMPNRNGSSIFMVVATRWMKTIKII